MKNDGKPSDVIRRGRHAERQEDLRRALQERHYDSLAGRVLDLLIAWADDGRRNDDIIDEAVSMARRIRKECTE